MTEQQPIQAGMQQQSPQHVIDKLSAKDRELFDQVAKIAQENGMPRDAAQNAAMAMVASVRTDPLMKNVDQVISVNDRSGNGDVRVFASYHPHGEREPIYSANVNLREAGNVPLEDSARRFEQQLQQSQIQQTQQQSQQQTQQQFANEQDPQNRGIRTL